MHRIIHEKNVFKQSLSIEEGTIETETKTGGKETYTRLRVNRPDASAVFIFNEETQKVILTRQFRYAIASKVTSPILEIVAGKVDPGEAPDETAIRESEEESGYRIPRENLEHLASVFASPGYSSEKYHLYLAIVSNADKKTSGGGLEEEHESIEEVALDFPLFRALVKAGEIADSKTLLAALLLQDNNRFEKALKR